jgi:VanZ family protein
MVLRAKKSPRSKAKPPWAITHRSPHNVARWSLAAYVLLLIYASLHPLDALRATEANPLAYFNHARLLWAGGRPYGVGSFDALSNFAAYLPLGFGVTWGLMQRLPLRWAVVTTLGICIGFSASLEALQTYNPLRVPSLWDVLINSSGAAMGIWLCLALRRLPARTRFAPTALIAPHAGAIWAVLGLWTLAQLHPQSWVFVTAPLRLLWGASALAAIELPLMNLDGAALAQLETLVASLALFCCLGVLRLGSRLTGCSAVLRAAWMLSGWVAIVVWQGVAYAIEFGPAVSFALWGSGVWVACWIAAMLALVLAILPTLPAAALTVAALGAYLTAVQWLPPHPYMTSASLWQYGKFTHLYGLTAMVSALWPVLALVALILQLRYLGRTHKNTVNVNSTHGAMNPR